MPIASGFNQVNEIYLPESGIHTPAFVYDECRIIDNIRTLDNLTGAGCRVLYSIKSFSCAGLLVTIADYVAGFSVSSRFEYQLAREILGSNGTVHLTSPGLDRNAIEVVQNTDYVSFNSLSQWHRLRGHCSSVHAGLRINPGKSYVSDPRYDPCRPHSKLGVPLTQVSERLSDNPEQFAGLGGIHVHNNCESRDWTQLVETASVVLDALADWPGITWINLGGGYYADNADDTAALVRLIGNIRRRYDLDVFLEPGKGIVGDAGYLISRVLDVFPSGDAMIAVLDTSVNHLPEVFEYQYQPAVREESPEGDCKYTLAGASCLSGDLFGEYTFDAPLEPGDRITFTGVGAYMLVKASMFNGINLPSVYSLDVNRTPRLLKACDYNDYRSRL